MTESAATDTVSLPRRPRSIAALAVLLLLYGLFTLLPKILLLSSQELYDNTLAMTEALTAQGLIALPFGLQIAISFIASAVLILTGVFLWRGAGWARWAVVLWMAFSWSLYFLQTGPSALLWIKVPVFCLVTFLLFRPGVRGFFR